MALYHLIITTILCVNIALVSSQYDAIPNYDNGAFATGIGISEAQTNNGNPTDLGFNINLAEGFHVADVFWVDTTGLYLDHINFYAYQENPTGSVSTTITGFYLQIWDGPPYRKNSKIVYGDLTKNRLSFACVWSNVFRVPQFGAGDTTRAIQTCTVVVYQTLPYGFYWLDWAATGSLPGGVFTPPVTSVGVTTSGYGIQYNPKLKKWQPAVTVPAPAQVPGDETRAWLNWQAFPFTPFGSVPQNHLCYMGCNGYCNLGAINGTAACTDQYTKKSEIKTCLNILTPVTKRCQSRCVADCGST